MSQKGKTQETIVEAAFKLFAEHGMEKTSLSMIAAEVGITKPAIYYYFPSKEALIDFLFEETFREYQFAHYFTLSAYTADNFAELLIANGLQMLPDEEEEEPVVLRVFHEFLLNVSRNEKYQQRINSMQEEFLDGFAALVARGIELGVISPEGSESKAHMLALVIDNISNYMLMGIKRNYKSVWVTAVQSVLLPR
ncbi:TetR/AcrR family transcriptional regulator [Brevibacillus fluminis]|uniref:TetR/AcrR family transcriptional regulator n=1 Tax=Brevibacillus fluminis TaxID=511487 RepID=A0A3M8CXX4_9BACL|nr:TetR/AcrR family transcriptional regulator [Brevibacillus fluminis]RNB79725.1 TetR/AcrR family transcriptional regulator [Brevibacillus fluminis]